MKITQHAGKIKKKVRDIKRMLNKSDKLPAQATTEAKRKLRALEFELGEKMIDEQERTKAAKYHKIKHFERKKVMRKLKQAKRALQENSDETKTAELQSKVDDVEIKLLYTTHFPKSLHYVSLFPNSNEQDPTSSARREKMLNEIRKALLDGDKDLSLLQKRYRDEYKEKLIKRGTIAPVAPVDEEMTESKPEKNTSDSSDEEKDDFFEKA
ncbi:rRNA-processing protein EFG1 [Choanephora cucurbitarum]|uniref:rRNA-processing protein EFG1 n=1 Tax=Choanephora cucurbitarum TaxID=101091 RepID=A0A1C7NNZ4_9FUNG|nr:rRNA-processing protein EFG1 [Choanephora cucurbitarum]